MGNDNRSPFLGDLLITIIEKKMLKHCNDDTSAYIAANINAKKNKQYHYSFFRDLIVTSIFWIIGIGCLISSYCQTMDANKIINQGNRVMATITNVNEYEVLDEDDGFYDERDVSLSYIANGQKYDCIIKEAEIYGSVGDETEIYYDSNDPTIIISSQHLDNKVSFKIPIGIAMCIFALFLHVASWMIARKSRLR